MDYVPVLALLLVACCCPRPGDALTYETEMKGKDAGAGFVGDAAYQAKNGASLKQNSKQKNNAKTLLHVLIVAP